MTERRSIDIEPAERITCSVMEPIGDGVRDLDFLRRGPAAGDLSRWYDTYDGLRDYEPDWYALEFGREAPLNALVFAHGPAFMEGGWWTSLAVQWRDQAGAWHEAEGLQISPAYDFSDQRGERKPFESFELRFDTVAASAIRLIGQAGGTSRTTTLSYLAAGRISDALGATPLSSLQIRQPRLFDLLPADKLWDSIASLRAATNLMFDIQTVEGLGLDHFIDNRRFHEYHARLQSFKGPDSLYTLLGDREGWREFGAAMLEARAAALRTRQPVIHQHHGGMAWVVVPVLIDGAALATIEHRNLVRLGAPDAVWHEAARRDLGLGEERYALLLEEIPRYTWDELQVVIELVRQVISMARHRSSLTTSVAPSIAHEGGT
ncbi:MAG TPA: PocR ligand-binding domain-containing protein [Herpetosiphonaceae bacterium]